MDPSSGGVVVLGPTAKGDDESTWDFSDMPFSSYSGHEQRGAALLKSQILAICAGWLAFGKGLDVLQLLESGWHDLLTLVDLCWLWTSKRAEAVSRRARLIV